MSEQQKRQSLNLSDENWEALDRLAAETRSLAIVGATQGRPSWRALVRRLATGELTIVPDRPSSAPPSLSTNDQPHSQDER